MKNSKIKIADLVAATKKVVKESNITRLVDLTNAMNVVYNGFNEDKYNLIAMFENLHNTVDEKRSVLSFNVLIKDKTLSLTTLRTIHGQYTKLIEEFIDSPPLNSKFNMDEDDKLGWSIYYELDKKIQALHYLISIESYKEKLQ